MKSKTGWNMSKHSGPFFSKPILCGLALLVFAGLAGCAEKIAAPPNVAQKPAAPADVLFWTQTQRETNFPAMEKTFPVHVAARGLAVVALPRGKMIQPIIQTAQGALSAEAFMAAEKTAGLLVLHKGQVRLESYGLGYNDALRWTSFSVAKSMTSTLVGAAIRDGFIKSVDEPVTRYITGLKGSAYDGVSIRQLLTMTSGVRWNEDYTDLKSDVALLFSTPPDPGVDPTVSYMRKLPREAAPGTKWVYKTGETNLIGVLVTQATGRTLADYLSDKIWKPFGMEQDAVWMVDERGQEAGGCCLSVSLRDYGRIGLFMLGGAMAGGKKIVPDDWIKSATTSQADIGTPGRGYGYQWWTRADGTYDAVGIFGQWIHIDPRRALVIVASSAWPKATDPERSAMREKLLAAIEAEIDRP
jgi:CubicO group peptidase (beta-lactamase class C family)